MIHDITHGSETAAMGGADTPSTTIDRIMAHAVVQPRNGGGNYAYISHAAHEAYATGDDHVEALKALRAEVERNWQRIAHCLVVLAGVKVEGGVR